eukprot:scaffold699_cov182-Amphora_coffeaeformis.AAC.3
MERYMLDEHATAGNKVENRDRIYDATHDSYFFDFLASTSKAPNGKLSNPSIGIARLLATFSLSNDTNILLTDERVINPTTDKFKAARERSLMTRTRDTPLRVWTTRGSIGRLSFPEQERFNVGFQNIPS